MLTADKVKMLSELGPTGLALFLDPKARKTVSFKTAKFVGITNGGQFCYAVEYADQTDKVFLTYNHVNNSITADM